MTLRGMKSSSDFTEARTDDSCRHSRSMAISANTPRSRRTPMLISLPCSSVKMRTEPDLITNRPSAGSPALQTVSPNEKNRDSACSARRSSSARVNGDSTSTEARKSATDCPLDAIFMCSAASALARFDDVLARSRQEPFFTQQTPHLGRGVLVQDGGILRVHAEDLVEGPVGGWKRSDQIADRRVEHLGLDIGFHRAAQHLAEGATLPARVGDRMFPRHVGEALGIVLEYRDHLFRLAFRLEHDVADRDAVEPRRVELEVLFDGLGAADLFHHLLLVQAVGYERFEFVQADPEVVERTVGVGRPVQPLDPA